MELNIYWTDFSKNELHKIFIYYRDRASLQIAKKLILGLTQEVLILRNNPDIGQREPLLKRRKHGFRYIVYKSYKVIYWVNQHKNRIEIVDVFDTRQNPIKMERAK